MRRTAQWPQLLLLAGLACNSGKVDQDIENPLEATGDGDEVTTTEGDDGGASDGGDSAGDGGDGGDGGDELKESNSTGLDVTEATSAG